MTTNLELNEGTNFKNRLPSLHTSQNVETKSTRRFIQLRDNAIVDLEHVIAVQVNTKANILNITLRSKAYVNVHFSTVVEANAAAEHLIEQLLTL